MAACGGPSTEEPSSLATKEGALTSATSNGCTFSTSYREVIMPHGYVPIVTRESSDTCPWGSATLELPVTYGVPEFSVVANELGVAVGYSNRYSPSGTSGTRYAVVQVAPATLSVVRSEMLASYYMYSSGSISHTELSLLSDGTTLVARGQQTGEMIGQTGSGPYFTATWPDFFTSTTAPTLVASATPSP